MTIPRCQHIKVNGTQCGSPALRAKRLCYFHSRHQLKPAHESAFDFPLLEDANAIQCALMQVIRAIADNKMECKRAGFLLYALQTASYNLKRASLEPDITEVVLDTSSLAQEVTPPPDPVDQISAMRRTYWKLRDPNLINRDREMVARYCAPAKSASAPSPGPTVPSKRAPSQSPAPPFDDSAPPDLLDDPVLKFLAQMTRSQEPPNTR